MANRKSTLVLPLSLAAIGLCGAFAWTVVTQQSSGSRERMRQQRVVLPKERAAAGVRFQAALKSRAGGGSLHPLMTPGGTPHYFGPYANWAYSPLPAGSITSIAVQQGGSGYTAPQVTFEDIYRDLYGAPVPTGAAATAVLDPSSGEILSITLDDGGMGYTLGSTPRVIITDPTGTAAVASATIGVPAGSLPEGGLRKFVDSLPGLTPAGANNLGQYIPVAVPDKTTYPGCDYYEIALVEYAEQMHSDLPGPHNPNTPGALGTKLRGYVQEVNGVQVDQPNYLGPVIVAQRDVPVRLRFTNRLPTGSDGNLFIPVDTTVMGAGMGPQGTDYSQNRATIHLHGNNTVWISDGTPHQWTTPAGEQTDYPHGVSVYNVPDMPDAGPNPPQGVMTFYYTNEQSARLMFYHDHSFGITRLNVLVGEAAGYLITDSVEQDLINGTNDSGVNPTGAHVLPDVGIPLVIQDKSYVDAKTIAAQDPTWNWGLDSAGMPVTGSIWYPHVYMPNQNPADLSGMNAFGRWHYGPWFYPPTPITHPPIANPYFGSAAWEPPLMPDIPNPSTPGEAFQDTPLVNGTAYPFIEVQPKAYRFRILNAANDRFFNLQLYRADPSVVSLDGRANTEVRMVPAVPTAGFPAKWPTDGRPGGAPDPATRGPDFIQIGTEGGFLPKPVVVPNQPITWNLDQTTFDMGVIKDHALFLGTAERADVIVDFSAFAGQTLILFNDSPAPVPAIDMRYDYFTDGPDLTSTGGAPSTLAGYGPNTRTIMQIRVANTTPAEPYDMAALQAAFAKTAAKRGVFEASQDDVIIPQNRYDSAYDDTFPADSYIRIGEDSKTFRTVAGPMATLPFEPKASHDEMGGVFDTEYGRMSSMLGLTVPGAAIGTNFNAYPYAGPPVDLIQPSLSGSLIGQQGDGTQIWKIAHNGVDTHTFHFHLFNVQLINRVAWDGALRLPDDNELGWKETVRVNPLQDTIVAMRPILPANLPFQVPNSVRLLDPTIPEGSWLAAPPPNGWFDPLGAPILTGAVEGIQNHYVNFGWEYVYHCHLLAHEEMDMMHSVGYAVAPEAPTLLAAVFDDSSEQLSWEEGSLNATGFTIQRATDPAFSAGLTEFTSTGTSFVDTTLQRATPYYYRVRANNVVGDTTVYDGGGIGFPQISADSGFSNTAEQPALLPIAGLTPSALAFGDQLQGTTSTPQSVLLANSGNAPLTLSLAFSGANAGDFAEMHGCGLSLAAGSSCSIDVTFLPSGMGTRAATLTISSDDPAHPQLVVALGGNGIAPVASLSTSALAFADQLQGTTSAPQTLVLSNTGTATLAYGLALGGSDAGDFAESHACSGTLAAGGSCSIDVSFLPSAMGARGATIAFSSDDPAHPLLVVALGGNGIAPVASLSTAALTFADQLLGTTSAPQTLVLSNSGTATMAYGLALGGANPGDFAETNACSGTLVAGGSCSIDVTFLPSAMAARGATLSISSDDPAHPLLVVTLTGNGIAPIAGLSTNAIAFADQLLGSTSAPQTLTLSNTGTAVMAYTLALSGANPADFAQSNLCGGSIAAGSSCSIDLTFSPALMGARGATLEVSSSDLAQPLLLVALTGGGIAPIAGLSTNALTFADQWLGTSSAPQTVTLSNTGTAPLSYGLALSGAQAGDFAQTHACSGTIAAGSSCSIDVTFLPSAMGARSAALEISSSDLAQPLLVVPLAGTGIAPVAGLSTGALAFGNQLQGTLSAPQSVLLSNSGSATLTFGVALTGPNAGEFAETHACAGTLAAGGSCSIDVTFLPAAMGARSATLTVSSDDPAHPLLVVALGGNGIAPVAVVSTGALAFGNQLLGTLSSPRSVTLSNTGSATLNFGVALVGANPGDFAETNACGLSLAAGSSCSIDVSFLPSALGARSATLVISGDDPAHPQLLVALSGTGVTPVASLSTGLLAFGDQPLGTPSVAQSVTLSNTGSATLTFGLLLTGANPGDFAQALGGSLSLAPGASSPIAVTFLPTAAGARSAFIVIGSNDPANPVLTVALTGNGTVPVAGVSPGALAFGNQMLGTQSAARSVTLSNTGAAPLTFSLALTGAQAGDFADTHACGSSIPAGGSCSIDLTFLPTGLGARSASLEISSNDPAHPLLVVALSGVGMPTLPVAPTSLQATIGGTPSIDLRWMDASDNETSFKVWRATNGEPPSLIGTVGRSPSQSQATGGRVSFLDQNVVVGALYSYYVVAVNVSGPSPASNTVALSFTAPAAPFKLTGVAIRIPGDNAQDRVSLGWVDASTNESDFQIQRSLTSDFANATSYSVPANTTTFAQNVSRQNDYYYRVRARNGVGPSAWSGAILVTTP